MSTLFANLILYLFSEVNNSLSSGKAKDKEKMLPPMGISNKVDETNPNCSSFT